MDIPVDYNVNKLMSDEKAFTEGYLVKRSDDTNKIVTGKKDSENENDLQKRNVDEEDEDMEKNDNNVALHKRAVQKEEIIGDAPDKAQEGTKNPVQNSQAEEEDEKLSDNIEDQRKKRDEKATDPQNNKDEKRAEIVDKLQASGDLKVSGNKSPLVTKTEKSGLEDDEARAEYEKEIEAQIQDKINAINEQVKREIAAQKVPEHAEPAEHAEREKRLTTLLDEENPEINPDLVDDQPAAHVRRRRHPLVRHKRANAVVPYSNSAFLLYRADDEDDDEGGEFDDDGFDDRTSNIMQKRQATDNRRFDNYEYNPYRKRRVDYMDHQQYLYEYPPEEYKRRKRESHHHERPRNRKFANKYDEWNERNEPRQGGSPLNDIFGELPETYQGELTRLKRVKRTSSKDKIK